MSESGLLHRVRALRADPVLVNSSLIFTTTTMMAAAGAIFWVVAAHLQSPSDVGLAGSLVSASDSLALFAQLGLNITLLQTMPTSERKAGDIATAALVVGTAGTLLGVGYALLLPVTSPRLTAVVDSAGIVLLFAVLVGGTAVNVLTDSVFLSINRVRSYLWTNGVMLGIAKLSLPFVLIGAGAIGLYSSVEGATLFCAVVSLVVIFRQVPGSRAFRPSRQLLDARRFAGAGYLTYVLNVTPQLVLPILVLNALGSANVAVFYISVQIITLQNAITLAVGNSMYAESQRSPEHRRATVRRGGVTLLVCAAASVLVMVLLAPYFLLVFGSHYSDNGTATLRLMSVCTLAFAFNYWSAMRLRIAQHLTAMVLVQLLCTACVLGLGALAAPHGTTWVALGWGAGQLVGGVVGFLASITVARFDDAPALTAPVA